MNKKYFLLLFAVISAFTMSAQSGKQKKADRLFEDFAYTKAIDVYKELLERDHNVVYNQQRIGDSYYKLRDPKNAVEFYSKVVEEPDVSPEVYYKYAQMLRGIRQYEESREWLKKYQQKGKDPRPVEELLDPEEIKNYEGLETFRVKPAPMNSKFSDFGAYGTGDTIYFVSARGEADTRKKIYDWTGEPFLDIYKTTPKSDAINPVEGDVNTVRHEGPLALAPDGKTMYFTRNNENGEEDEAGVNHLKIYKASWEAEDEEWDDIEPLPFNSNTYSTGHPSLSADGTVLYFASDAPGGIGGSDLYKVTIQEDGYSEPENLGPAINTSGNEVFPYVAENGNFYFSSDGHKGYGLLDVFVVTQEDPEKIQNLGKPVNSSLDDFGFSLSSGDSKKGYISSNRPGGPGSDDIYELTILDPLILKGQVTDSINGKPIANATVRLLNEEGEQVAFLETDEEGNYSTEIARDKTYPVEAKHIEYNTKEKEISTINTDDKEELVYNIELAPIRDVEYLAEINKIYFDFDKAEIRPDAARELDKLVDLMKNDYPNLVIEIGSHTDKRGSEAYNRKLAKRRAQATYDYLVKKGIEPERIVQYKGYGEMRPDVDCMTCNEEQHQLNRRSVFRVVKME